MKKVDIHALVRPSVRTLRAYSAKEIPCRVKLDANESPYAYDSRQISRLSAAIMTNRYPDPEAKELKKAAGKRFGVKAENILQGNGSDELIYYLIAAFGGPVLYPVPTFSMYGIISRALG
ncbi:MAG TPA: aminotransferase class I/II-fold pyridoxal phosphate-dependent enzyme, partial [Thermodesulfovibrionales bacterium]|nr:aminotransferase class I/II-fold pyridoxal phosphate-dependent enzyme [Thermodesulfovibrionales bacterium]